MLIRILLAVLAAYLVLSAAYVILILLLVAGLIFRTKETLGLIALCWLLHLFSTHPVVATVIIVAMTILGAFASPEKGEATAAAPPEAPMASELAPLPPPNPNAIGLPNRFDVILLGDGGHKIQVIKELRTLTGIGLTEAKVVVECAPQIITQDIPWAEASKIKAQIEKSGGSVDLKIHIPTMNQEI